MNMLNSNIPTGLPFKGRGKNTYINGDKKLCNKCGLEKPFLDFYADKKGIGGLGSQCKQCMNDQRKVYIDNNPDKLKQTRDTWRQNNPNNSKDWHTANPDYNKNYYQENSEAAKIRVAQWAKDNPDKIARSTTKQRAGLSFIDDGTANKEFVVQLYATKLCYYCGTFTDEKDRTIDHKVPVSRGGVHGASNLVMSCVTCNKVKFTKTEDEFICILK